MKYLLTFTVVLVSWVNIYSQTIKSKDGVIIGDFKEIVSGCVKTASKEAITFNNINFKVEDYCSCMVTEVIPSLTYKELDNAMKNNSFVDLMMRKDNLEKMMDCGKRSLEIEDDFTLKKDYNYLKYKDHIVQSCASTILEDPEARLLFSNSQAIDVCDCAITKMYNDGYNFGEISNIEDINSVAFNEIILGCIPKNFFEEKSQIPKNSYASSDIIGSALKSTIQLINFSGSYKLKIKIGNEFKYFTFDTGAADLIIDQKLEQELFNSGSIKGSNYLGTTQYRIANNEIITAKLVRLDNIQIGNFTVNNVIVGVVENGTLLCGTSFFDKFQKWDFDSKNETITIYR
jgi:hypothetical protein